jgi:Polyketide cyclase / dehydrase and lipid transport
MPVSVTKYVQIDRPVAEAYAFLADPATMPKWAIHNVRSIKLVGNGRWEMDTPRGKGFLIPHYQKPNGILDHDFIDAGEGFWSVTARAVPIANSASVYMITLTKPDAMPMEAFEGGMKLMDEELTALKACVEAL